MRAEESLLLHLCPLQWICRLFFYQISVFVLLNSRRKPGVDIEFHHLFKLKHLWQRREAACAEAQKDGLSELLLQMISLVLSPQISGQYFRICADLNDSLFIG